MRILILLLFIRATASSQSQPGDIFPGYIKNEPCIPAIKNIPVSQFGGVGLRDKFRISLNGELLLYNRDYKFLPESNRYADSIGLAFSPDSSDTLCFEIWTSPLVKNPLIILNKKEDIPVLSPTNKAVEVRLSSTANGQTALGSAPQYQLDYGGNKSLQVTVGEGGGMNLEQSLELDVNGQISKNLYITGHLSDHEIPIQPEGNTATLKEVDQIFVKIYNDKFSYTLGDYVLNFGEESVDKVIAKVQGMYGQLSLGDIRTSISASRSRGTYHSYTFNGVFGKQTGYYLQGKNNEPFVTVLAGTESIWLNGNRLSRGKHYQMEYGEGRIDFLNAQIISGENQFTVEFQYIEKDFPASLYSVEIADTSLKLNWSLRSMAERDFKEEAEENEFRQGLYYQKDGSWQVADSNQYDSLLNEGVTLRSIRFSNTGQGGYIYSQQSYIPDTNGTYAPILPELKTHSTFSARFKSEHPNIYQHSSDAQISHSYYDSDLYSKNKNNRLNGLSLRYRGDQILGRPFNRQGYGQWQVLYNAAYKSENYTPLRRVTEDYSFRETWNMNASKAQNDYFEQQGSLLFKPLSSLTLGASAGKANSELSETYERQTRSERIRGLAEWMQDENFLKLFSEMKLAEGHVSGYEGANYKWGGSSRYTLKFVTPMLSYEQNEWIDKTRNKPAAMSLKQTWKGGIVTYPIFNKMAIESDFQRLQWQSNFSGTHEAYSDSLSVWEFSQRLRFFDIGPWQSDLFFAWQNYKKQYDLSEGPLENQFYLMEWHSRLQNQRRGYAWNTVYRINQTVEVPLRPVYIRVSPGTGTHWCRDSSLLDCEPSSENNNDYELIGSRRDTSITAQQKQDLNWSGTISFSPGRFPFRVYGILSHMDFALQYRFNAKDTSLQAGILPVFTDNQFEKKTSGESRLRPSIRWTHPKNNKTLALSYERKFTKHDYPFQVSKREITQSTAYSHDVGDYFSYDLQQDYRRRIGESATASQKRETDEWEGNTQLEFIFRELWAFKPSFKYLYMDGNVRNNELKLHSIFPRLRIERRWLAGGRSFAEYGLHAGLGKGSSDIFLISIGYPKKYTHRFEAGIDFRANQYIFCNASYLVRLEPNSDEIIQRLSAEVRAVF